MTHKQKTADKWAKRKDWCQRQFHFSLNGVKDVRIKKIHVTDHAMKRWHLRASKSGHENVHDVINAVKHSNLIKKDQLLPYGMPRLSNTVYSIRDGVVFVMEAIDIEEYRLLTVMTENEKSRSKLPKNPPSRCKRLISKSLAKKKREKFNDDGSCANHKKRTAYKKIQEKEMPQSEEIE